MNAMIGNGRHQRGLRSRWARCVWCLGTLLFLVSSLAVAKQSPTGITLHGTRVIFSGAEKGGVSYSLTNNTKAVYLLQARMLPWAISEETSVSSEERLPLVVVPPLQRMEPQAQVTLRLREVGKHALPQDRESVFMLVLKTIPNEEKNEATAEHGTDEAGVMLRFALQNNLKVFYRPVGLPNMDMTTISQSLTFRRDGETLWVKNPTPYYVTFDTLAVGKTSASHSALAAMTPPLSEHAYPIAQSATGPVSWAILNDYGEPTETQTQTQ